MTVNEPLVLSPLADPVVGAIFCNVESAGLAAESLIRAVLASDDAILTGKIISVTPQYIYNAPRGRGCRIDVVVITDANERVIFEVQVYADAHIMTRDLFSAAHVFTRAAARGDTAAEMAAKLPKVICINILGYNIRSDNNDVVQPFKILYTKPPQRTAIPHFSGYNVQLPRIAEMKPDFLNPLYCWGYTLHTAHANKKSVQEVIEMTPELQMYAETDNGYFQFCKQYDRAAANPTTMDEYRNWVLYVMREEGMRIAAVEAGREEERAKWQQITNDKDAEIARLRALLGDNV